MSPPVTYGCWASIIQYFEFEIRLKVFMSCPKIAKPCSNVPVSIYDFSFDDTSIRVNNLYYKVGVIRHCTKGNISKNRQKENRYFGVTYDVEQFGDPENREVQKRIAEDLPLTKEELILLETNLRRLIEVERQINERNIWDDWELMGEHRTLQWSIKQFEERLANSQSEYSHYIQLTASSSFFHNLEPPLSTVKILSITDYTTSIENARKYFFQKLIPQNIRVETSTLDLWIDKQNLPFKYLSIGRLHVCDIKLLDILKPMLTTESLKEISLFELDDFAHPMIKTAKCLLLNNPSRLLGISNQNVEITNVKLSPNQAKDIIENWMAEDYPVGKRMTFEMYGREYVYNLWQYLEELPGALKADFEVDKVAFVPYCITFPMIGKKELNVFFTNNFPEAPKMFHLNFIINAQGFSRPFS